MLIGPLTSLALFGPLVWLLIVSGILRLAYWTSRRDVTPMQLGRHHAAWAGVLALLASGFIGSSHLQTLSAPWGVDNAALITGRSLGADLVETGRPFASMAAIFVIAQFTGPRPRSDVRVADLAVRRVRDYLPLKLTVFAAVLVFAGIVAIGATAALPAIVPPEQPADQPDGAPSFATAARVSGLHFAAVAGGAHLILVLGVLAALVVIVRRPRVPILSHVEDSILLREFINRILRLTALLSAVTLGSCLGFAAMDSSENVWNVLRMCMVVVFIATLLLMIAARPTFAPEEVDQQVGDPSTSPGAPLLPATKPLSRAGLVVLSGRRLGYLLWSIGMAVLLVVALPLSGLPTLGVLCLSYLAFLGFQLFTEKLLIRNVGPAHEPGAHGGGRLSASLLLPAVPTVLAVVGTAVLALWLFAVPGWSPGLPFSLIAYGLLIAASAITLRRVAGRPRLRDTPDQEDDELRGATVRRILLITQSAMLAVSAFLVSDNRSALAQLMHPAPPGVAAHPSDTGGIEGVALALLCTAIVVAVLPARLPRHTVDRITAP